MTGSWDSAPSEPYVSAEPPPDSEAPTGRPSNAIGIASLIIGLVALLASFTVAGGLMLGALAAILGVIARAQVRHGQASNGDVAMTGIVLGVLAILASTIIAIFWLVPARTFVNAEARMTSIASEHQEARG
jgi:hypothetical protein